MGGFISCCQGPSNISSLTCILSPSCVSEAVSISHFLNR